MKKIVQHNSIEFDKYYDIVFNNKLNKIIYRKD